MNRRPLLGSAFAASNGRIWVEMNEIAVLEWNQPYPCCLLVMISQNRSYTAILG
jgi:hypothetical protein